MNRPSPDDMKAMWVVDYVTKLEMENKKLKEENEVLKNNLEEVAKELIQHHEEYKNMADMVVELQKESEELKKKLEHYENTRAIQKSNDASRWIPWFMSCVDREQNVIK